MTEIVIPYTPRGQQFHMHQGMEAKRWSAIVAHRRFGKTVCVVNHMIKMALTSDKRKPFYAYLAPYYNQAKAIAWEYLLYYTGPIPGRLVNRSELSVTLSLPLYDRRINSATIRLFGADNPDSLRGLYYDGAVLDEFGDMKSEVWDTVLRPALADRLGWGVFIGTPKGRNKFWETYTKAEKDPDWFTATYKADETGVLPDSELTALKAQMSPSQYAQEFECSFEAAIQGAYYANELQTARTEGRVRDFNIETGIPVHTVWDLGMDDYTAIIFYQNVAREVRIVDFYEANGEGLSHYAKVLQDKGYLYGDHFLPHDVEVKELGTGKSRKESLEGMGLRVQTGPRLPVEDGIEAARKLFAMCWFRESAVMPLVDHLQLYRRVWDDRLGVFRDRPVHDLHSHAADAFRYLALTHTFNSRVTQPVKFKARRW